jgi:hypothetical protein
VNIPTSVQRIGDCAFDGCSSLNKVTISVDTKLVWKNVFNRRQITRLELTGDGTLGQKFVEVLEPCLAIGAQVITKNKNLPEKEFVKFTIAEA